MPALQGSDLFASAVNIYDGNSITGSNVGYSKENGEGGSAGSTSWYQWIAATSGTVQVDTIGSSFDTYLGIWQSSGTVGVADTVTNITFVTQDDDSGGSASSKCTFTAVAGTVYYFQVGGYSSSQGNYVLNYPVGRAAQATGGGGGSSGTMGVGNMLGALFMGDTMLGGDPGSGSGSGGGTGSGNMLGGFFLGDTMLGGDPGSGTGSGGGGAGGSTSNTYSLVAVVPTRTLVTGDVTRITQFIQARSVATRTTVAASLTMAAKMTATVATRTTVRGGFYSPVALAASVSTRTTVSANASVYYLRGRITTSTSATAKLALNTSIRPQTVRALTTVTARLSLAMPLSTSLTTRTTVTGNAVTPRQVSGTTIAGATSVTGTLTRHLLRGRIATRTSTTAQAALAGKYFAFSNGRTTVSGRLSNFAALTGSIATRTAFKRARLSSYPTDFYDVEIRTSSTVSGSIVMFRQEQAQPGYTAIKGRTAVSGSITGYWNLRANVSTKTTVVDNLTYPRLFATDNKITGATAVTGDCFRSTLRGGISNGRTDVAAFQNVASRPSGAVRTRTSVTARFVFAYYLSGGSVATRTTVKARAHVYPLDFQDVYLSTGTKVRGSARLYTRIQSANVSTVVGRTTVAANPFVRLRLNASVKTRTTVASKIRNGFGATIFGATIVRARVGIRTGLNSLRGTTIVGSTKVTGVAPSNGFKGVCAGTTKPTGFITLAWRVTAAAVMSTQFHTHFGGRNAHEGPFGSVALTAVPRGDLGVPDEIGCSSRAIADVTVERSRLLSLSGNTGLAIQRERIVNGTAIGGTETRLVGVAPDYRDKVLAHATLYT